VYIVNGRRPLECLNGLLILIKGVGLNDKFCEMYDERGHSSPKHEVVISCKMRGRPDPSFSSSLYHGLPAFARIQCGSADFIFQITVFPRRCEKLREA
jgi:hypothetical protein